MKKLLMIFAACVAGFSAGYLVVGRQMLARHAAEVASQQNTWQAERAVLEGALEEARRRPQTTLAPPAELPVHAITNRDSAEQILARLRTLKASPGAGQIRAARLAIHDLEELLMAGTSALPAIHEFLKSNEDFEFIASNGKANRSDPGEFVVPPTIRFGLFDVVKRIGGPEAERLLAEMLSTTARGPELAWLSRTLEAMAPGTHREAALVAARRLLESGEIADGRTNDRDLAYKVLSALKDASYVANAQAQLVRADGQVDKPALQYLLQTLGPNAVPLAAQLYDDPRITDANNKEPFARLALNFVGADQVANEFYVKAINDFRLSNDARKNLIEDLNQDGFVDRKNLTAARDLPLIDNRLQLIIALSQTATDPVNIAALKEAYKDLARMRDRIVAQQVR